MIFSFDDCTVSRKEGRTSGKAGVLVPQIYSSKCSQQRFHIFSLRHGTIQFAVFQYFFTRSSSLITVYIEICRLLLFLHSYRFLDWSFRRTFSLLPQILCLNCLKPKTIPFESAIEEWGTASKSVVQFGTWWYGIYLFSCNRLIDQTFLISSEYFSTSWMGLRIYKLLKTVLKTIFDSSIYIVHF